MFKRGYNRCHRESRIGNAFCLYVRNDENVIYVYGVSVWVYQKFRKDIIVRTYIGKHFVTYNFKNIKVCTYITIRKKNIESQLQTRLYNNIRKQNEWRRPYDPPTQFHHTNYNEPVVLSILYRKKILKKLNRYNIIITVLHNTKYIRFVFRFSIKIIQIVEFYNQ